MNNEKEGPGPEDVGSAFETPDVVKSPDEITIGEGAQLVQRTLVLAEQWQPELLAALYDAVKLADPFTMKALDPDSEGNKRRLSEQQRENLKRAWAAIKNVEKDPNLGAE